MNFLKKENFNKFVSLFYLIGFLLVVVTIFGVYKISPHFNNYFSELAFADPSNIKIKLAEVFTNNLFTDLYIWEKGFALPKNYNSTYAKYRPVLDEAENAEKKLNLKILNIFDEKYEVSIGFETESKILENFPEGIVFYSSGKEGMLFKIRKNIFVESYNQINTKVVEDKLLSEIKPLSQIEYRGKLPSINSEAFYKNHFKAFFDNISNSDFSKNLIYMVEGLDTKPANFENIHVSSINFTPQRTEIIDTNAYNVGRMEVFIANCDRRVNLDLIFDKTTLSIKILSLKSLLQNLCPKVSATGIVQISSCIDCTLFNIDKQNGISSSYVPSGLHLDVLGYPNQYLIPGAFTDFVDLRNSAISSGYNISIISSFRSFDVQNMIFENYINEEMNKYGYTREQAIIAVNRYSAKPGFSEHQLGSTLDINSAGCSAFSYDCTNEQVWKWLEQNAWKFGFVLSYPSGSEHLTGYIYEPWHYRWIGRENALEFLGTGLTLNKWLEIKKLYF